MKQLLKPRQVKYIPPISVKSDLFSLSSSPMQVDSIFSKKNSTIDVTKNHVASIHQKSVSTTRNSVTRNPLQAN